MRKLIICIFTLAAFIFSSVTAFADSGIVMKYTDEYTEARVSWSSWEDGVTELNWIQIQIGEMEEKGGYGFIYYWTESFTDEGEYLGYRDFSAQLPEGSLVIPARNFDPLHILLDDVAGIEHVWNPEMPEDGNEPVEKTYSFDFEISGLNEDSRQMYLSKSRQAPYKFNNFSKGVTFVGTASGTAGGVEFEGDGDVSFSSYKGMMIGKDEMPEEPEVKAAQKTENGKSNVIVLKGDQKQLYSGWEEYDPDTYETRSYRDLVILTSEEGTYWIQYFEVIMDGVTEHLRRFQGSIPADQIQLPKKLGESFSVDLNVEGMWTEYDWSPGDDKETEEPEPVEGTLSVSCTWHFEYERTYKSISKYSSTYFSFMNHESSDSIGAWTEGTIDGEPLTGGWGEVGSGRYMIRMKDSYPME
ncbi:hypothetical protein [Youngiibacter fragilis]|uniref:Uncharacterized protein n=1 Tax=Youngiibacter fragilis 232.1 TaxID=994573 RepID=V7I4D2_9CLOT|nr:hypothetical protein [Youngiibacter fragilis]ETA79852.1 hypothetical protein T472_0215115 [Youngiibacter fragilis 232.1]